MRRRLGPHASLSYSGRARLVRGHHAPCAAPRSAPRGSPPPAFGGRRANARAPTPSCRSLVTGALTRAPPPPDRATWMRPSMRTARLSRLGPSTRGRTATALRCTSPWRTRWASVPRAHAKRLSGGADGAAAATLLIPWRACSSHATCNYLLLPRSRVKPRSTKRLGEGGRGVAKLAYSVGCFIIYIPQPRPPSPNCVDHRLTIQM